MHEHLSNYYVRKRIGSSSQYYDKGNEIKGDSVCNALRQDVLQHNTKHDPCNTGSDIKTVSPSIVNQDMGLYEMVCKTYRDNFTTHGLSKIFTGLMWEKIFWFTSLFGSLSIIVYFTYGFYVEYNQFDYRTEIRVQTSQNITLPTATICDKTNT